MELEDVREEVLEELLKDKKESWINYLALTTVLLAVCATLSSFKENNNSVDTVLFQTTAANAWSHFQAKSIKGYLYEMQREKLSMDAAAMSPDNPLVKTYTDRVSEYDKEIARYAEEKKDIAKEAKKAEKSRDEAQKKQDAYGMAMMFLQTGILLSSVSALLKKKPLWYAGMGIGAVGIFFFVNGMLLLV